MTTLQKTKEQVKAELSRQGLSVSGWAKRHGFTRSTVRRVVNGKSLNHFGPSHKIAVLLGMKDGIILDD
ncbi:MAG: DNA-binding protein [Candidatus Accumulibacter sp.]|uniref:DNA-binding protein n=1 Tax=Accumulibacter sp. TaxID=2053492 RepID=UPI0025891E01|nr:DNA-binding protein [Accumulibacter sp.]MCM8622341.1 DNA-binding protein [Accumulibacter sp.]